MKNSLFQFSAEFLHRYLITTTIRIFNSVKIACASILLLLSFTLSATPYNGIFTIGGVNPDFSSLQIAIDSLTSQGMNGAVALNIRAGVYQTTSIVIDSIPGNSIQNPLYIQSELGDSASVTINGSVNNGGTLDIRHSPAVILSGLTIINNLLYSSAALHIEQSSVTANNLHLVFNPSGTSVSDPYLIVLLQSTLHISYCDLSTAYGIMNGGADSLYAENCIIFSSSYYGLGYNYNSGYYSFRKCIFPPAYHRTITGMTMVFDSCRISRRLDLNLRGYLEFSSCDIDTGVIISFGQPIKALIEYNRGLGTFGSLAEADSIYIIGNNLKQHCEFYSSWVYMAGNTAGDYGIDRGSGVFENNSLSRLSFVFPLRTTATIRNNVISNRLDFYGGNDTNVVMILNNKINVIDLMDCDSSILRGNEINTLSVSHNTFMHIYNNWIRNNLRISNCRDVLLHHNNVLATTFDVWSCYHAQSWNNNFAKDATNISGSYISDYNNYFPNGGYTEPNSLQLDPMYPDSIHLINRNPQLAGAGRHLSNLVPFDKDSLPRKYFPTIGAHEFCFESNGHTDTVLTMCNLPTRLTLCDQDSSLNYIWTPATGLSNIHSFAPIATITTQTTYIATITNGANVISRDTFVVIPEPFQVVACPDATSHYCGSLVQLSATENPLASYSWTPGIYLDDSLSSHPACTAEVDEVYVVCCTVPGCGTSFDTVHVTAHFPPTLITYIDSIAGNEVYFNSEYSRCTDTYLWDFGDSSTSTVANPVNVFPDTGTYLIQLIGCNYLGCDTQTYMIHIDSINYSVSIPEQLHTLSSFTLSPNPSNGLINIEIGPLNDDDALLECYDTDGELKAKWKMNPSKSSINFSIDISGLNDGLYLFRLRTKSGSRTRKVVLLNN